MDSLLWMVKDCLNQKLRCVYTKLNAFGGQVPFLGILACSRLGLQIRQTHKVVLSALVCGFRQAHKSQTARLLAARGPRPEVNEPWSKTGSVVRGKMVFSRCGLNWPTGFDERFWE